MKKKKAKELYSKFHGRSGHKELTVELGDMSTLVDLGRAHSVCYEALKEHLGDTEKELYEHEFEKPARLYWNGTVLIIAGKSLQVNERGILN
jgi:hypothetical protein